ncbi:MAG: PepSY domain-containing protein [Bacteroidales bacterium]|nr:PepSY domain-containing protein [Bacteroidales bacterium]
MKKIFRQLHLWLSVPFGLIVTLICFSGAMLVFEQEVNEATDHDLYYVASAKGQPLPIDVLVAAVQSTLPDSVEVTGVSISPDSTRAYQVALSKPRRAAVTVDQYTGQVKGRIERSAFFSTMFRLHRWLLDSFTPGGGTSVGKVVVGISTIVFIIVLITGIVIWWPRSRRALKESLKIPFRRGSHRFWYGLHVAGGMYALVFILAMALTGLTWSFSWYRTGFYALFGAELTQNNGHGGDAPSAGERGGRGGGRSGHHGEGRGEGNRGEGNRNEGRGNREMTDSTQAQNPALADARQGNQTRQHPAGRPEPPQGNPQGQRPDSLHRPDGTHQPPQGGTEGRPARPEGMPEGMQPDSAHRPDGRHDPRRQGRHRPEGEMSDSLHGRPYNGHTDGNTGATNPQHSDARPEPPVAANGSSANATRPQRPQGDMRQRPANMPQPADSLAADSLHSRGHGDAPTDSLAPILGTDFSQWQTVYETLAQRVPQFKLISINDGRASVSTYHLGNQRAADTYNFNPGTGEITSVKLYAEADSSQKIRGWIYSVHVGNWGGFVTRLIAFLAALLGASLPLTGYYLWIKRLMRRRKR